MPERLLPNRRCMDRFFIDPDIRRAETLPSSFYGSREIFDATKDAIFAGSWHWLGDRQSLLPEAGRVTPILLLEDFLSEPLLLVRDKDEAIRCLSNVCTHRANLVVEETCQASKLVCGYHGRQFDLYGRFLRMPEFADALDFPRPCDDLRQFPIIDWSGQLFASLAPVFDIKPVLEAMYTRVGHMNLSSFKKDETRSRDYDIQCHWALYCDNYLEGFHIPFVHDDLNESLDYSSYETILYPNMNLQVGYARNGEHAFKLPKGHPDAGKDVAAYYFWIFPNIMFNFYPWGLSVNIVKPLGIDHTRVSFVSYVYDADKLDSGAGSLLDKVEKEDEAVVENVHAGLKSRFYKSGRFSPTREKGVHQFHSLLAHYLNERHT